MQTSQGCSSLSSRMNPLELLLVFLAFISLLHQATGQANIKPTLTVDPRFMRVEENYRLNTVVLNCSTSDANSPDTDAGTTYAAFNYGNYERRFVLAASTCELYVVQPLDYETTTRFDLGIRVVDLEDGRVNRPFTLFVSDVNDNAPTCSPYNILGSMSEDAPLGATIATFDCSDVDTFFGGQIQFEVISGDTDVIVVGLEDGVATLNRTVDFDTEKHTFVVAVRVKDKGTPSLSTTASVILDITDVDDNPPVFAQTSYLESTPEDTPVGTTIFRVSATDQDQPNSLNSLIVFGFATGPTPDLLMIDQRTGDLVVKTELDFEVATEITCQVYAYSSTLFSHRATVNVRVLITDVNDGVPVFTMDYYRASIPESAELGDPIVTVQASDPDSGVDGNVTYSVASADFKIEPHTGLVTVNAPLDYEVRTSYLLLITATDGGSPAKSSVVFLQVSTEPVNEDTPQFTGTFSFETPENALIGTSVHTAEATDSDFGVDGVIVYTLLTTGVPFSVDSDTGTIRVAFSLDYESQDFYSFLIEARDKSAVESRSSTQNYTVDITNSNDIPVICDAVQTHVIPDATLLGYVVTSLQCRDPDSVGATFSYNITSGNDGTFEMNDTLNPENLYSVTFPKRNKYDLTLGVSDGAGLTLVRFAVITETQLEFTNLPASVNVTEGTSGFVFFTLAWCCPFYYARTQIMAGNDANKVVAFTTSGDILLVSPYDRESQDTYQYTFQVFSTSGQVGQGTLTVNVEDSNDNIPEFESSLYFVNVVESVGVGTTVRQYLATDADLGIFAEVNYSIASGNSGGHFRIDSTGQLIVNASLNFETTPTYTLVLHAADGGSSSLTGSTTVVVTLVNVDDNPPTLALVPGETSINVSEDSALGVRLTQLQAFDNDAGINFTYGLIPDNTGDAFLIDPGLGVLYLGKILDREETDSYTLNLTATDQNEVTSILTLTINVIDVNDNDPVFALPVFQYDVAHNTGPGLKVGDLLVTDLDEGLNADLNVFISGGNAGGEFTLTGREIFTAVTTNYELVKTYTFTVKATDAGVPSRTGTALVVVTVLPSAEMPMFNPNNAEIFITEGTLAGYQVFDLNATVLGASEIDGSMEYAIQSAIPHPEFEVKQDTGEILTIAEMDYERYSLYTLVVRAYIVANASNFDDFTLTIRVINTNDHSPYFNQGFYSLKVSENAAVGTVVDTIQAQDDDLDDGFGVASQSFTGSSDFQMDNVTGMITVSKTLNFLNNKFYVYLLTAFDGGSPARSVQVSVVIRVEDYNDNTPTFISGTTTSILDSVPEGSEVYHFHATDLDTGVAGALTYSIDSDSSGGKFSLDHTTGILNTTTTLNAAVEPSYTLTVRVQDGGSPMLQATTSLAITVVAASYNNNDPSFPAKVANVFVARNAVRGTTVTTARATDLDLGLNGQVIHKAISGNEGGFFLIDSDTGIITTATRLFEAGDTYTLLILARDKGIPSRSSSMTVNIGVTPLTSVTTTFDYAFTVSETAIANSLVGTISVDPDRIVTGYSIDLGNVGDVFSISTNGVGEGDIAIAAGAVLDYEAYPLYSLLISATTDIGSIFKVVVISVVDVNDHPPVFPTSTLAFDLSENTPVGTVVRVFSYTDGDTAPVNRANVWALANPGPDLFSIDQSGQLIVSTSPNFETVPSLTFDVTVTDTQSPFTVAKLTVTVSIVDVEESETMSSSDVTTTALISLELPYQSAAGHVVHTLTMGDFGIASSPTASVEFMSINAEGPFTIDSSTGAITVVQPSTLKNATQYILWVVCKSTDGAVTTSRMALVRLDTFDQNRHMVVLELAESLSRVQDLLTDFLQRGQAFFPPGQRFGIAQVFDTGSSSRRKLLATQSVAHAYVVSDTSADDIDNINQGKSFMSGSDILAVLQHNSDGSPVEGLSDPAFLEVNSVGPYQEGSSAETTFFMTPGGIAVLVLLGLLVVVTVVVVVTYIYLGKKKAKQAVSAISS